MSDVRVEISADLSDGYDRRYVIVDAASGAVIDDAQGYGYKSAQNAHRAHAYKSMSPEKKRQRNAIKDRVRKWCDANHAVVDDLSMTMFYAMKDGDTFTAADVDELLSEKGIELPFTAAELLRHW